MSRLDELPPDQRATLSLLLAQRKSYAEVASMLGIGDGAVHDRAHAALAVLAPAKARELSPEQREEIGEYVLGAQPGIAERLRTRALLERSQPARSWALALVGELEALGAGALPDIPSGEAPAPQPAAAAAGEPRPAPTTPPPSPTGPTAPSSRLGGALVLAAILAAIIVAVVLATSGGGSSHKPSRTASNASSSTSTGPAVTARVEMRSPNPSSRSIGLLQILSEGSKRAFYIVAEHMPATSGYFYALWLYNSPSSHEPLGKAPPVGSSHRLEGGGALPANAAEFHEVLLTRETSTRASAPGHVVLRGTFSIGS